MAEKKPSGKRGRTEAVVASSDKVGIAGGLARMLNSSEFESHRWNDDGTPLTDPKDVGGIRAAACAIVDQEVANPLMKDKSGLWVPEPHAVELITREQEKWETFTTPPSSRRTAGGARPSSTVTAVSLTEAVTTAALAVWLKANAQSDSSGSGSSSCGSSSSGSSGRNSTTSSSGGGSGNNSSSNSDSRSSSRNPGPPPGLKPLDEPLAVKQYGVLHRTKQLVKDALSARDDLDNESKVKRMRLSSLLPTRG